jgi:hypothetical protein
LRPELEASVVHAAPPLAGTATWVARGVLQIFPLHDALAEHAFPQVPQFELSESRFAQNGLLLPSKHNDSGAAQVALHVPGEQTWAPVHWFRQLPQFAGSRCKFVHVRPSAVAHAAGPS